MYVFIYACISLFIYLSLCLSVCLPRGSSYNPFLTENTVIPMHQTEIKSVQMVVTLKKGNAQPPWEGGQQDLRTPVIVGKITCKFATSDYSAKPEYKSKGILFYRGNRSRLSSKEQRKSPLSLNKNNANHSFGFWLISNFWFRILLCNSG